MKTRRLLTSLLTSLILILIPYGGLYLSARSAVEPIPLPGESSAALPVVGPVDPIPWSLAAVPAPPGLHLPNPAPLLLEMTLDTTLTPHLIDQRQAILFKNETGQVILRYDQLLVTDATERELPAHFELHQANN